MEAIGLVASIITLISAASHATSVLERVLGLRGISLYVLGAINEVSDFKATLTLVQTTLEETQHQLPLDHRVEYTRLLDRAMGCMNAFTKYLRKHVLRDREQVACVGKAMELKRRMKWTEVLGGGQTQCQINAFQQELASLKLSFVLVMSATNLKTTSRLYTVIQDVTIVHAGDVSTELITRGDTLDLPHAMEKAACMSTTPSSTDNTMVGHRTDFTSYIKIETIRTTTHRICRSSCPCDCHTPLQGTTPRWLRGLLGVAFFNFTSAPSLKRRPCNYGHCHQGSNGSGALRLRYFFPAWLLPIGIEVAASWQSLSGVGGTWSLKIPQVINDNDATGFLENALLHRSLLEIEKVMIQYGIRGFDMLLCEKKQEPMSLLTLAIDCSATEPILSMLLDRGADIDFPSPVDGFPAQEFGVRRLKGQLSEAFGSRPDISDTTDVLNLALATRFILGRSMDSLEDLLRADPSVVMTRDSIGNTPLHWAVTLGDTEAINLLVKAGADLHAISKDGSTPLCNAVRSTLSSPAICIQLLEAGADVHQVIRHNATILTVAALGSYASMTKLFLDAGAIVDGMPGGYPPLTILQPTSTPEHVEHLLRAGADINARDPCGETAVMQAVLGNHHAMLETLIHHGAQLNLWTYKKVSIVHFVAAYGDVKTMQILEEACIEGLPMEEDSLAEYWWWFNERYNTLSPYRSRDPPDVEESAFQALLDSITPAEFVIEQDEDTLLHIPGAFPIDDLEEFDCDSGSANGQQEEDNDGLGVKTDRERDDETAVATDEHDAGDQELIEDASDDEDVSTTGQMANT